MRVRSAPLLSMVLQGTQAIYTKRLLEPLSAKEICRHVVALYNISKIFNVIEREPIFDLLSCYLAFKHLNIKEHRALTWINGMFSCSISNLNISVYRQRLTMLAATHGSLNFNTAGCAAGQLAVQLDRWRCNLTAGGVTGPRAVQLDHARRGHSGTGSFN